jgi:membrane protease YdiL (CAAX protease family)
VDVAREGTLLGRARAYVVTPLADSNSRAAENWRTPDRAADRRLLIIVLTAALYLFILRHVGIDGPGRLVSIVAALGMEEAARDLYQLLTDPVTGRFWALMIWALAAILCLFVLPAVTVAACGGRLRDHGISTGSLRDWPIYLALIAVMIPVVALAAFTPSFQTYYPFYVPPAGQSLWPYFVLFELAYMIQFVGTEFFFRGFLLHGAKHRFGAWAILLPLIPYMMVHFGKPPMEAAAAVVAGLVLGFLSLKTGSILYGIFLHAGVALGMDLASLYLQGRL